MSISTSIERRKKIFLNDVFIKYGNKFEYNLDTFIIGIKSCVQIKCQECNTLFKRSVKFHLTGKTKCPNCKNRLSIYMDKIKKKPWFSNYDYSFITPYNMKDKKINVKCLICFKFQYVRKQVFSRCGSCINCSNDDKIILKSLIKLTKS